MRHTGRDMKVAFQKWGNSLALRVPKAVAQEIGASDGKAAEMSVRDGKLVIEVTKPKRRKRRFTLDELVAGITPENRHEEVDWGPPVGNESGDYCPDAGDLIWIDLSPTVGHEQSGCRPVLVLTSTKYNGASGLCVACPITSRVRGYPFKVAMPDDAAVRGAELADQARSLSWEKRYLQRIDRAPGNLVAAVRERIAAPLDIG